MNANAMDELGSQVPAWGKLRQDPSGRQERHALIDHMLDVAAVFAELARSPAVRRALERTAQRPLEGWPGFAIFCKYSVTPSLTASAASAEIAGHGGDIGLRWSP